MDSLFFWLSKLLWLLVSPDSLLLILLVVSWLLLMLGRHRAGKILLGLTAFAVLAVALLPLGEWLLYPLESRFVANPELPDRVDGIIVLSGPEDGVRSALWQQVEIGDGAERNLAFLSLARRYPDARLVYTGGTGSLVHQNYKAADVAKTLFASQGLDLSRVVFERDSRNTYENAKYSRALANPGPGESWVLITSAGHMPRSVGIFCRQQWPVIPYPVDHWTTPGRLFRVNLNFERHLHDFKFGVREWIGLAAYRVTGKTTGLIPAGCSGTS